MSLPALVSTPPSSSPTPQQNKRHQSLTNIVIPTHENVFVAGRPPWYTADGALKETFIIGIGGGSASGKTSVSQRIIKNLKVPWVVLLCMDSFYKELGPEELKKAHANDYNFDHPDAFDYALLLKTLKKLRKGKSVEVPIYDFTTHSRSHKKRVVYGANVVVFEGIFALYDKNIMDLMDLKIFVDTDADVRLSRRLKRDITERGRDLHGVIQQYNRFVKPAFDDHIFPTMKFADVIIPRGSDNIVAIDLITKHISRELDHRGFVFRDSLAKLDPLKPLPASLIMVEQTNQIKAIMTILRNKETDRDDFIFYSQRICRLIVERTLAALPHRNKEVITALGEKYEGKVLPEKVCGVSIVRAGMAMETGLRKVCMDIPLGKLLIQTDKATGEPQLHYCRLPPGISDYYVMIMDATIATGAAAIMAIRVLLDHDVPEENIIFASILCAPQGIHAINYAFPRVRIVTAAVDESLSSEFYILPGMGNFGDRYFGTY